MEFFNKAKAVRLRSHLDKFLTADSDKESVCQSRNGSSQKACWIVELVEGKNHVIRLKSCYDKYLIASDEPFLLAMTGKKVVQSDTWDVSEEWEPIREGDHRVKLRSKDGGMYLRANGGTPPWRNSVTHDFPYMSATQSWVLWEVEALDVSEFDYSDHSFNSIDSNELYVNAHSPRADQNGMEYFEKAKVVILQNHHGKYLVAHDDESSVRQSHNGSSEKARWTVEFVTGKHKIRLKSCHGMYLTAIDEPFLLGMTGKKVVQDIPASKMDSSTEWEPIKEGLYLKLQSDNGNFLRANWGTPPWRNSITHDTPHTSATQDWLLWRVEVVDFTTVPVEYDTLLTFSPSFSPAVHMLYPYPGPPLVLSAMCKDRSPTAPNSGMEFFEKAKSVRLKSYHSKYLRADHDRENVFQNRNGTTKSALWIVEFVEGVENVIRLKSIYGRYLTATDQEKILGLTGRKVLQTMPKRLDSSVEWEPIKDGAKVKLKTRYGNFLRGNGGLPPWRNSITHDIPYRHNNWILWDVDVVEKKPDSPKKVERSETSDVDIISSASSHLSSPTSSHSQASESGSPVKSEGRIIYYTVADDMGNIDEDDKQIFKFTGHGLGELAHQLEEETGIESVILCSRNPLNGKLHPLRLALPPNNVSLNTVLISATSTVASEFE